MGWNGLKRVITKIASAPGALGGIHGARSERRRCQEHHARYAARSPYAPPALWYFHKQKGLPHPTQSPATWTWVGPGNNKVTENSLHAMPWPHGAELYKPKDLGPGGTNNWAVTSQHVPGSSIYGPSPLSPQGSSHNHAMANGPDRRQHTFPPPPPRPGPSLEASGTNDQRATLQQKQQQRYPERRT